MGLVTLRTNLVVGRQSASESLDVVVRSLDEGLASQVIGHGLLGGASWREARLASIRAGKMKELHTKSGQYTNDDADTKKINDNKPLGGGGGKGEDSLELLVVRPSTLGVDQPTGDSRDEESIGDLKLDGVVNGLVLLLEHRAKLLSLGDRSGEAVEDESDSTRETRRRCVKPSFRGSS